MRGVQKLNALEKPSIIDIFPLIRLALEEDIGSGDVTANLVPANEHAQAHIITREAGVLCGQMYAEAVFRQFGVAVEWRVQDGDALIPNQIICLLEGPARGLLTAERTALNFLQMLSGTATVTRQYVEKIQHTKCQLLDTRKTIPGFRHAQKYAVRCGGGHNHRMGLFDAFLIKENHIAACGSIQAAVHAARRLHSDLPLEVEVENQAELEEALAVGCELIMLDNYSLEDIHKAVKFVAGRAKLEVSGNVNVETIASLAETGVDFISVGALTKHIRALDLSMRVLSHD